MRCHHMTCSNVATHKVTWPGNRSLTMCNRHQVEEVELAMSLGIIVNVEEIKNDTSREGESDSQGSKNEVH